jgi:hypothetical protein
MPDAAHPSPSYAEAVAATNGSDIAVTANFSNTHTGTMPDAAHPPPSYAEAVAATNGMDAHTA